MASAESPVYSSFFAVMGAASAIIFTCELIVNGRTLCLGSARMSKRVAYLIVPSVYHLLGLSLPNVEPKFTYLL